MRSVIHSLFIFICLLLISAGAGATAHLNSVENGGLFFVFNQPGYAPGDTAYFTGYLLPIENQPVSSKQIVSIKLIGTAKEIIYHGRILFQDGVGISQIIIPQNTDPGNYQFVSYIETSSATESPVFYIGHLTVSVRDYLMADNPRITYMENDTTKLRIVTDRDGYGRRSRVNVSIMPVEVEKSSLTSVSIAVYNEQLFKDNPDLTLLSTAQPIRMESESKKNNVSSRAIDFPNYFMGRAFIKSSGKTVPDSSKITFYLSQSDFVYMVYTHGDGNFSFPLFNNFGNEEIFYRISYKGKRLTDSQIILHDSPVNTEVIKSAHSDTLNAYGLYAKQKQFIGKSYQYFVSREKENMLENKLVSEVETDSEVLLEKFESFSSMAEVFSNITQSVRYKKNGDDERIRIFLKITAQYGMNDPLYIVDGIMTDDTHNILSLDPKSVKKIGVLRSQETLTRFGDLGLDGILVIDTSNPTTRESARHSENSLSLIGISKAVVYKKVTYSQNRINSRVPDLRSSLYWNPNADLSKIESFDFYTGDDIGYYIIQMAGLLEGKPFLSTKRFYVSQRVEQ